MLSSLSLDFGGVDGRGAPIFVSGMWTLLVFCLSVVVGIWIGQWSASSKRPSLSGHSLPIAFAATLVIWFAVGLGVPFLLGPASQEGRGQFGDQFGAANALFAGVGLILVAQQLRLQALEFRGSASASERQSEVTLRLASVTQTAAALGEYRDALAECSEAASDIRRSVEMQAVAVIALDSKVNRSPGELAQNEIEWVRTIIFGVNTERAMRAVQSSAFVENPPVEEVDNVLGLIKKLNDALRRFRESRDEEESDWVRVARELNSSIGPIAADLANALDMLGVRLLGIAREIRGQ